MILADVLIPIPKTHTHLSRTMNRTRTPRTSGLLQPLILRQASINREERQANQRRSQQVT